ncbi:hypothetical protein Cfor_04959 [Coptotermes formosanus]|uniref:Proline-rich transmembrane protein 3/4 domain-containing protein n=1 Tax=Coptotermes formosanus TaxID=36987 RepID=A0A6L2PS91_COPFO|nr:hypothetical protein Cfor_04959 [Coptotermes formosanus]
MIFYEQRLQPPGNKIYQSFRGCCTYVVAYGGVTTTKRSISSKYFPSSGTPTTVPPPFTSISVPTAPPKIVTPPTPPYSNSSSHKSLPPAPPMHPTTVPPFTPPKALFPPSFTTPAPREEPSYIPPIRSFFTPPLPPEYANPFADKPTLRGSNSDGGISHTGRRPIPPPPRPPSGRDRIPLRPPDLAPNLERDGSGSVSASSDRKKPLNTPSFNRSPEAPYSELDKVPGPSNQRPSANDSDFEFVPILHYPSVSRILSGSNGRRPEAQPPPEVFQRLNPPESKLPRMPEMFPKLALDPSLPRTSKKDISPQPVPGPDIQAPQINPVSAQNPSNSLGINKPQPPNIPSNTDSIIDQHTEGKPEQLPDPQPQPPKLNAASPDTPNPSRSSIRNKARLAWDVHVYLIASLFTVLAVCSLVNIFRVNICKRLLSRGYYITLHGVLLIIGIVRSVYLFYDAYNVNSSFPEPISHLLLNIVLPLLTSAFIVLFMFLLYASKVHIFSLGLQRPSLAGVFIILHILLCITMDLSTGIDESMTYLPLICQSIFIILCISLGFAYLYAYKHLSKSAAVRKQDNIFGSGFTNITRPTLAVAVRATLATALLSLLMAAVQLYGIFGPYSAASLASDKTFGWLWWGYQFSVRVIEVSMCFLLSWAGVQPLRSSTIEDEKESQNSGFALFRCGQCNNTPQSSEATDDIYPAVCVTNQAIHDYTVRTGKKVYDDSFPLNNLHSGLPLQESTISISTSERRSLRKTGYVSTNDSSYPIIGSGTVDCRTMMKKSGTLDIERPDFDLPFPATSEVRHSLKNSSCTSGGGSGGGGGTLISLNGDHDQAAESVGGSSGTMERRPMKKSGTLDPAIGFPGIGTSDVRRSIKKSGTMASLNSERRTPVNQHRGGTQTLCSTRECSSPSMLVAENGFVRFRALADPEEQDMEEMVGR